MKKIKHLILHIGTRKTGSTSIQETLGRSREALLKHNIYYPAIKPYNHIFSFLPIFMKDPTDAPYFKRALQSSEDIHLKVRRYREAWVKEIERCEQDHFVISAEEFTQPHFAEDAVSRLKSFAEQYFEKITLIVYVRHYDQLISSQIQQEVMTGYRTVGIEEFVQEYLNCPSKISYKESLEKWINVFGRENLIVRPFDPEMFHNNSLLADFFYSLGLPAEEISISEIRTNQSLGKHAVNFLLKYNQAYPLFVNDSINPERGMAKFRYPGYLYRNIVSERFNLKVIYSPEQARKFNEEIDYVNQFFTDGYQFHQVTPGNGEIDVSEAGDIPVEYFVELINNYNKQIETLQDRNLFLREQNATFQEKMTLLQEQNAYYRRIVDVLRIPLIMRVLEKLKLKRFIQILTKWISHEKN